MRTKRLLSAALSGIMMMTSIGIMPVAAEEIQNNSGYSWNFEDGDIADNVYYGIGITANSGTITIASENIPTEKADGTTANPSGKALYINSLDTTGTANNAYVSLPSDALFESYTLIQKINFRADGVILGGVAENHNVNDQIVLPGTTGDLMGYAAIPVEQYSGYNAARVRYAQKNGTMTFDFYAYGDTITTIDDTVLNGMTLLATVSKNSDNTTDDEITECAEFSSDIPDGTKYIIVKMVASGSYQWAGGWLRDVELIDTTTTTAPPYAGVATNKLKEEFTMSFDMYDTRDTQTKGDLLYIGNGGTGQNDGGAIYYSHVEGAFYDFGVNDIKPNTAQYQLTKNQWVHVDIVKTANNIIVYQDKKPVISLPLSDAANTRNGNSVRLGYTPWNDGGVGLYIDNLEITDGVKSNKRIYSLGDGSSYVKITGTPNTSRWTTTISTWESKEDTGKQKFLLKPADIQNIYAVTFRSTNVKDKTRTVDIYACAEKPEDLANVDLTDAAVYAKIGTVTDVAPSDYAYTTIGVSNIPENAKYIIIDQQAEVGTVYADYAEMIYKTPTGEREYIAAAGGQTYSKLDDAIVASYDVSVIGDAELTTVKGKRDGTYTINGNGNKITKNGGAISNLVLNNAVIDSVNSNGNLAEWGRFDKITISGTESTLFDCLILNDGYIRNSKIAGFKGVSVVANNAGNGTEISNTQITGSKVNDVLKAVIRANSNVTTITNSTITGTTDYDGNAADRNDISIAGGSVILEGDTTIGKLSGSSSDKLTLKDFTGSVTLTGLTDAAAETKLAKVEGEFTGNVTVDGLAAGLKLEVEEETVDEVTTKYLVVKTMPKAETPNIEVNYADEKLGGFASGTTYIITVGEGENATMKEVTLEDGENAIDVTEYIGKTIGIVRKGESGKTVDSDTKELTVGARLTAPVAGTDFTVTQPNEIGEKGSVSGLNTETMEMSTDGETWTPVTDAAINDIAVGTSYYFRYKATNTSFKSASSAVVTITAFDAQKEETPAFVINYEDETLEQAGVSGGYTITVSETPYSVSAENGKIAINSEWFGKTISIIKNGNGHTTTNSEPQSNVEIKIRRTAPAVTGGEGKITGTTTLMEYKKTDSDVWEMCSADNTEVEAGTYEVRYAVVTTQGSEEFASVSASVTVTAVKLPEETEKPDPSPSANPDVTDEPSPSPSASPDVTDEPSPSPSTEPEKNDYSAYLFVHFTGKDSGADTNFEQIYFSLSKDGENWEILNDNKPVLKNTLGTKGVRDPYIIRGEDGTFYIIATDLLKAVTNWGAAQETGSRSIIIWETKDLTDWGEPRIVEVMPESTGAGCVWAPEAVWDEVKQQYMVFWASRVSTDNYGKQRIYRSYTTDFESFTAPAIYIEEDYDVIDATIVKSEDKYYRFIKNESDKYIYCETSSSLDKDGWTEVTEYGHVAGPEGPTCFKTNGDNSNWTLMLDFYGGGKGYKPYTTSNLASGVFTEGTANFPSGVTYRHGSVLPITQEEYDAVKEAYKAQPRPVTWEEGLNLSDYYKTSFASNAIGEVSNAYDGDLSTVWQSNRDGTCYVAYQVFDAGEGKYFSLNKIKMSAKDATSGLVYMGTNSDDILQSPSDKNVTSDLRGKDAVAYQAFANLYNAEMLGTAAPSLNDETGDYEAETAVSGNYRYLIVAANPSGSNWANAGINEFALYGEVKEGDIPAPTPIPEGAEYVDRPEAPLAAYDFENGIGDAELKGHASIVEVNGSKTLYTNDDGYITMPVPKDETGKVLEGYTVSFDVKNYTSGNYFNFTVSDGERRSRGSNYLGIKVDNEILVSTVNTAGKEINDRADAGSIWGKWTHFDVVVLKGVTKVYVNKELKATLEGYRMSEIEPIMITFGLSPWGADNFADAYYDNIVIYDVPLNKAAIEEGLTQIEADEIIRIKSVAQEGTALSYELEAGEKFDADKYDVYAAVYNKNGALVSVKKNAMTGTIIVNADEKYKVKAMVWLKDTMTPAEGYTPAVSGFTVSNPSTDAVSVVKSTLGNPVAGFDDKGNLTYGGDVAPMVVKEADGTETMYLYVGHDNPGNRDAYVIPEWLCYSSKNLTDWTYEGVIMDAYRSTIPWAGNNGVDAWASQAIEHNGKYYFYFCTFGNSEVSNGRSCLGVAIADSPTGPFVPYVAEGAAGNEPLVNGNALGLPDAARSHYEIDPTVWIETDENNEEHIYLNWGNTVNITCELNADMVSVKDITGDDKITKDDFVVTAFNDFSFSTAYHCYTEAPWIYRRKGEDGKYTGPYYLFFAEGWRETYAYATTDDLMSGKWNYKGRIMQANATANTSHGGVVDFGGKTYFVYHNGSLPLGSGYRRVANIQELVFNEDGTIDEMEELSTGVSGWATSIISGNEKYVGHEYFINPQSDASYPITKDVTAGAQSGNDTKWELELGKADKNNASYVSIQSVNKPGLYIAEMDGNIVLTQHALNYINLDMDSKMTFITRKALNGSDNMVSFESLSAPGKYLTVSGGKLILSATPDSEASSFRFDNDKAVIAEITNAQ